MNQNHSLDNFVLKIIRPHKAQQASTALLVGALLLISGCADPLGVASGATVDYRWNQASFDIASEAKVAIGVVDRRPEILSGEKDANFVGLVREGFGIPFDAITQSNFPLVGDMAFSIGLSLEDAGIKTEVLDSLSFTSVDQVRSDLMRLKAHRYVLVVINTWRSNTYSRTELKYALDLIVYTPDGAEIMNRTFSGSGVGSDSSFAPKTRNANVLAKLYPAKLKEIFENDKFVEALTLKPGEAALKLDSELEGVREIAAESASTATPSNETSPALPAGNDMQVQASTGFDLTGIYVSDITSNNPWRFKNKNNRSLKITFEQNGNEITGINKSRNLKITGTLEGDEISFFTWPSDISSDELQGKWKVSSDGRKLEGKWSHPNGGGTWNLTRIE